MKRMERIHLNKFNRLGLIRVFVCSVGVLNFTVLVLLYWCWFILFISLSFSLFFFPSFPLFLPTSSLLPSLPPPLPSLSPSTTTRKDLERRTRMKWGVQSWLCHGGGLLVNQEEWQGYWETKRILLRMVRNNLNKQRKERKVHFNFPSLVLLRK